jgi:hypothetical protein
VGLWAAHFTAIYGAATLACARGFNDAIPPAIAIATILAACGCGWLMIVGWRHRRTFEAWLMAALAAMALLAILWEALPVLMVPPCV